MENQRGNVLYFIPSAILLLFVLYVVGALVWDRIETEMSRRAYWAEQKAKQEAEVEKERIRLSETQLREVMAQNKQLIEQNQRAMDRITLAHETAADEIAGAHREASGRISAMAEKMMAIKTDKTLVFILAGIAGAAVAGLVAVIFFILRRGSGYPEGPVIISMDGGKMPGRIAAGADVYRLIEHRKEAK